MLRVCVSTQRRLYEDDIWLIFYLCLTQRKVAGEKQLTNINKLKYKALKFPFKSQAFHSQTLFLFHFLFVQTSKVSISCTLSAKS